MSRFEARIAAEPAPNLDIRTFGLAVKREGCQGQVMVVVLMCAGGVALALLTLATLTALGGSRRGLRAFWAVLAGLVFPITWAAWYVRDRRAPDGRAA